METFAPAACRHTQIRVNSEQATDFIDVTDRLKALVAEAGIRLGFVVVQSLHTTGGVVVNENEPLLLSDFAAALENAAPVSRPYRHDNAAIRTVNVTPGE